MRNETKFKFGGIELTIGSYKGVPVNKWGGWCYKHKITIVREDKRVNFTFFNSQNAYSNGQEYLTERDMKDALDCIISDAICYYNSGGWNDFANEFGYEDYTKARRVYRACADTYVKLTDKLGIIPEDLFDIANYLRNIEEAEDE